MKRTQKGIIAHRVQAHRYREPRRAQVMSVFCPACGDEFATVANSKQHYQGLKCSEAQVAAAFKALIEDDVDLDPPGHAFDRTPFPDSMPSISPKIQIWEVGATADFMISLIQWSGAGISVGKLLSGYRSCALQSRCNRLQVERHMRYFCAVIDALYAHQILDSLEKEDAEPPMLAVKDEDTDADQPLAYI